MNVIDMKARGIRIRRIRVRKNISEAAVSEYMGIARESYRRIEQGKRDLRCAEAIKLAERLKVHPSIIIGYGSPQIQEEHVYKLAIDNGFDIARQLDGRITISPRLVKFAQAVVSQIHV